MYFFPGNANISRGQATVDLPTVFANSTEDVTVEFEQAQEGNVVSVQPVTALPAGLLVTVPSAVTTDGEFTIRIANITASSVAPGSDVVFNVDVLK